MNQKRLVCLCKHISLLEIKKVLRAGALTTAEVQQFTSAGTGCGRCISEIESIVEKHKAASIKEPQLRINFR